MSGGRRATAWVMTGLVAVTMAMSACVSRTPADTLRARGDRAYKLGDYETAVEAYQGIADRYPGDWEAQFMLGMTQLERGNLPKAREALEIAYTRRPQERDVVEALAETIYRQGYENELFEFLRNEALAHPSVDAWLRLADYGVRMNDPDSARSAIVEAIEIDGGQSTAPYLAAANLAERVGDDAEAIRRLRQAYGIDPYETSISERLRAHGEVPGPTIALPPGA